jgi:hypothetical protein
MTGFIGVQSSYADAPPVAYAGLIADASWVEDAKTLTSAEASASIPFGVAVAFKPSPTYDTDATMPANSTDKLAGVMIAQPGYARTFTATEPDGTAGTVGELDGTGVKPGAVLAVLRKGRIWVKVEDGCAVGDRPYVRYSANGGNTQLGAFRSTDDSGHAINAQKLGQYLTSCGAGGFAQLEVDFTNAP